MLPTMSSKQFDRMVAEIRAGAVLALILLGFSLWDFVRGDYWFGSRGLTLAELVLHGSCAVAIFHLSRIGSVILFADLILRLLISVYAHGPLALFGLLYVFVGYRSLWLSFRLHMLLARARGAG